MMNARHMRGVYVVEFALVGAILLVVLLGVLEMGRLLFTVNALNEVARRGARLAAVCDIKDSHILHRALFNEPGDGVVSSLIENLQEGNLKLEYFDEYGKSVPAPDDLDGVDGFRAIRFVQLRVQSFSFNLMIPLGLLVPKWDGSITLPTLKSIIPRESLGRHPEGPQTYDNASGFTPC